MCISNYHINQPFTLCFANVKRLCPRSKTPPLNVQGTKPSKSLGSTIGSSQGHMATKPRGNIPQFGLMVSLCFKKQNCWLLKLWTCFGEKHFKKTTFHRHVLQYAVWNINWELNIWRIAIGYPNIFRQKIR